MRRSQTGVWLNALGLAVGLFALTSQAFAAGIDGLVISLRNTKDVYSITEKVTLTVNAVNPQNTSYGFTAAKGIAASVVVEDTETSQLVYSSGNVVLPNGKISQNLYPHAETALGIVEIPANVLKPWRVYRVAVDFGLTVYADTTTTLRTQPILLIRTKQ